ncbi:N-formylglutamate amidohydrolase [Algirhabdus cladophorae]|uniref:N-formylglutamate amidohydrolase n=1 Tax=Algirhabdus cladophorae TaxID=3377108 RepID=UPI003B845DDE
MPKASYILDRPQKRTTSVVFASPHSGSDYGWSFLNTSVLDELAIRSSEDAFVDHLFGQAPKFGAPLLKAGAPRAFIDLNRSNDELDPALIHGVRRVAHNPRVASGLGVIPRVVAGGRAIYNGKMTLGDAQARINRYWHPYHDTLARLMRESLTSFGEAILLDCHSMPHEALETVSGGGGKRPQIVLGDRFGASANGEVVERVESIFASAGLRVVRNAPFAGAYVTQAYGRPSRNQHVVQIEIDRSLYMDEARVRPNADFESFACLMTSVVAELADIGRAAVPVAAE